MTGLRRAPRDEGVGGAASFLRLGGRLHTCLLKRPGRRELFPALIFCNKEITIARSRIQPPFHMRFVSSLFVLSLAALAASACSSPQGRYHTKSGSMGAGSGGGSGGALIRSSGEGSLLGGRSARPADTGGAGPAAVNTTAGSVGGSSVADGVEQPRRTSLFGGAAPRREDSAWFQKNRHSMPGR